jgi:asparagine synthase (glutamine-hydrolysing)
MCGICGIVSVDGNQVDPAIVAQMNRQITHRGPDDGGFFIEGNVGLGARRLSIIDIAAGHQPICNEDETLWIVYNGEIYNHKELRRDLEAKGHKYRTKCDTETIVHLYEEYGRDCVTLLRGMFAFAIWDRRKRRLFAARDRLGIKPFYYFYSGATFLFGSEIKSILAYPGIKAELEVSKLSEYLAFGYISDSKTMFSRIMKLLPGHTLELNDRGEVETQTYWDLPAEPLSDNKSYNYYVEAYRGLLEKCVSSHLMSDVPLGVFLSGGLDSSAVAALATKVRGEPIQTFSVGYEESCSELGYARTVAQHLRSEHHEVFLSRGAFFDSLPRLIWHEDEPIVWPSSLSLYLVARLAREHVTVVLTGEGSDETLAGYERYGWTLLNKRLDRFYQAVTPARLRSWLRNEIGSARLPATFARRLGHTFLGRDGTSWESLYFDNFYSAFSADDQGRLLRDEMKGIVDDPYARILDYWQRPSGDLVHRMLYTDIKTYLQELLMKQDQMSMAASIESRVPFLDHVLVEFTASIPKQFLIRGLAGKSVLKSAVEDLLPRSIIYRKKMGFPTPWSQWLNGPQLDDLERILLEPRTAKRGLFRPEVVRQLFQEHRNRYRDHGNRIWRLLNLELWQRIFIDGESIDDVRI